MITRAATEVQRNSGQPRRDGQRAYTGVGEPVLGANVFRLAQTVPDCLGVLVQVGGSPFDCAGLGSTDRMRMACKRPGVSSPLSSTSRCFSRSAACTWLVHALDVLRITGSFA